MAKGKKYNDALKRFDREQFHTGTEAIELAKSIATAKFDETVEAAFRLGVDPRKADQMVRGTVALPAGTGKAVRVAVFAAGDAAREAEAAGAEYVGSDDLAAKIEAGTSFDAVASEMNLAPVDLGLVEKAAIPDQKIADAAFSIEGNGTSGVVEGIFGPVILHVARIEPESLKPLDEVSGELRKTIALEKADEQLYDTHDRLEDERAAGETLTNAAKNVGLTARTIDAVDLTGRDMEGNIVKDIPESQKLLSEAFQTDEGVEADPISIGSRGFAWYEVAGVTPDRQKEFDEVREQVRNDWIAAETVKAVEALAETVRERVAKGETLAAVASELLPANSLGQMIEPETVGPVQRTASPEALTPEALREGFRNAKGSVFVEQGKPEASKAVIVVSGVDDSGTETVPSQITSQLNGALADDIIATMVGQMQDGMKVTVNQQAISAAIANQ